MTTEPVSTLSTPTSRPGAPGGNLDRVPPQDIEAEKGLLGAMMLDREIVGAVLPIIHRDEAEAFYRPDHQRLFGLLVDMYDREQAIDLVTVRNELNRREMLDEVGGVDYLVELAESIPSLHHAEHYARVIRDKALLRDLIRAAGHITDEAYSHRDETAEVLDRAERFLFQVTDRRITEQAEPVRAYIEQVFHQIEAADGSMITGLDTGFFELNERLSGLQPGDMIIVAARPSMGKTAFGLNMAEYMAATLKMPAAFFSMEMSKLAVTQRLLCSRAGVDSQYLRQGRFSPQGVIEKLQIAGGELADAPLYIDDTPGMSVLELRAKSRRLCMHQHVGVIFVDYLQLMHSPGRVESRQQEVAEISRGLKALARERNVPVVVMAQLNRNPEGRTDKKPLLSDLRESGAIEQDADVVLFLHREEYYYSTKGELPPEECRGKAHVIIAKQRNGPTGTIELQFAQQCTRFHNLSHESEPAGYVDSASYGPPTPEREDEGDAPF